MKSSLKKQIGVVSALLIVMTVFSIAAPAITRAQYTDPSSGESVGSPTVTSGLPTSAQSGSSGSLTQINDLNGLTTRIASIGTVIVYLLVGLAVVFIVWSVVIYFIKGKEGEGRGAAGMKILWGIVGLAIIISLWGLVNILLQTFGTNTTSPAGSLPQANFVNNGTNQ